ncbi:MAG: hypothetical protein J0L70_03485 [Leptolyngbya sp. UWPOB_LEPTO1]|uniref:hypothetical protein n=1 Tax=Leptolyngbya sp. UWPOB_LEPTO1 TaxID=2815653 RepID=UPI001AC57A5B|nr:hypothetical protein [Leptolyngbya sp. UWPOB_LEPTO1]MBN8559565.1 hypothetical protein [Leptolyngbya sp. UWPOB_LEPTO1]
MEVLKFTTTIDESGHLHLDIPTELSSGQVDIVVIVNPSSSGTEQQASYDFSDLAGQLEWQGDAVSAQRALRDEW